MKKGTILSCSTKNGYPQYIIYNGEKEYSCSVYPNKNGEYEMYPGVCRAKNLQNNKDCVPVGNVDLKKVILDAIQSAIAGESAQEKELNRVKKALAYMWFAYEKKEEGFLNDVEKIAVKEAQEILGPWKECMGKYMEERMIKSES